MRHFITRFTSVFFLIFAFLIIPLSTQAASTTQECERYPSNRCEGEGCRNAMTNCQNLISTNNYRSFYDCALQYTTDYNISCDLCVVNHGVWTVDGNTGVCSFNDDNYCQDLGSQLGDDVEAKCMSCVWQGGYYNQSTDFCSDSRLSEITALDRAIDEQVRADYSTMSGELNPEDEEYETGPLDLCAGIDNPNCDSCMALGPDGKTQGMWTALGCIPTNVNDLTSALITIGLGVAGIILFAQIIIGAGQMIFASGDSNKLTQARKRITNSIIAILFIIFGVTILEIIGVHILRIPGFFN